MANFDDADLRTLALAAPEVSAAALDGVVRYEEAIQAQLDAAPGVAHEMALKASGLNPRDLPALRALCEAFGRERSVARQVERKLRDARPPDPEAAAKLQAHLDRLRASSLWTRRYGPQTYRLLEAREAALVRLFDARMKELVRLQPPALPV